MEMAARFQSKLIEEARLGRLGKIRTRHAGLQSAYAHLMVLLDNPEIPILFYGEAGSGKRRHVEEYANLHQYHRELQRLARGQLKVFRGDFVQEGFTQQLSSQNSSDVIYVERVDLLSLGLQQELLDYLKIRKVQADQGQNLCRLLLGSERPLSLLMRAKKFHSGLFEAISGFSVFLPPVSDRHEDLPHLLMAFAEELTGKTQTPPAWLVNWMGANAMEQNFDEVKKIIRAGFARNAQYSQWTEDFLPKVSKMAKSRFVPGLTSADQLRSALVRARGNRRAAAMLMGMPYADFLTDLVQSGIRFESHRSQNQ
jgi:transcriptional regulator of acetoin/glycerol metabolism